MLQSWFLLKLDILTFFSNNHKSDTHLYSIVTWKYYSDDKEQNWVNPNQIRHTFLRTLVPFGKEFIAPYDTFGSSDRNWTIVLA